MNKNNKQNFWKDLWGLLRSSQNSLKVITAMILFLELSFMIGPYILKIIIDRILNFNPDDVLFVIYLIILMFVVNQFNSFLVFFKERRLLSLLVNIEKYLIVNAQKKLVYLSLSYHEKENTGNKISKIERGIDKINAILGNLLYDVVPSVFQLIFTIIALLFVDYRFALSILFFAPIFLAITFRSNIALRPTRKKRFKNYEKAAGIMGQSIININTVKSFVQEKKEVSSYKKLRKAIAEAEIKEWFRLINFGFIKNFIIDTGRVVILLLGVYFVFNDMVTIGTLVFVITLSEKAYFSLYRFSRIYDRVEEGREAVKRLIGLDNERSNIINPVSGIKPKGLLGDIRFSGVNFSYNSDKAMALKNINLRIREGCVTALVGPSGGGKTTVARMIYRHYDPQAGSVSIDGVDLKDYDIYSFRSFISMVPQEVELFSANIENNISYAKPRASQEEIRAAAKIANAHEFIEKLPQGYKTEVGERGIKLSGGQRQRIGIARAILANPRVLIFDEATSNLDSRSERLIQDAMEKISKGRTVILIAHRLSTIKKADKIIVLEDGGVVQEGSHFELSRNKGGLYSRLIKLQELGEID